MSNPAFEQPTDADLTVRETGLNRPPEVPAGVLPPGAGQWPVPHQLQFVGLVNQFARAYRWTFDEALKHAPQNAVAMRNDLVLMEALRERQMMTAQLAWHLEPRDPTDQRQVDAGAKLEKVIRLTPNLQSLFMQFLEAIWYGRYAMQFTYEWDRFEPDLLVVKEFSPINGDSLVARWGGDWGILVNGTFPGDTVAWERGKAHFFTPAEREVVVVHSHEPEAADYRDSVLAGGVKGVGVRGRAYWYWWFKSNFLGLQADYVERFANGVWIAYYDQNNAEAKQQIEDAVAGYRANRVLTFPVVDPSGQTPYRLEIKEVGSASSAILHQIIEYFDGALRRFVLGLAMADGMDLGVGGDGADILTSKVSRTVKYDAHNLAETLTRQWLPVLAKYNTPGVPPPRFVFDVDAPAAEKVLGYAERLAQLGGAVDLPHLYALCGLPQPGPGDAVGTKIQPLSPVGVGAVPQGVPQINPSVTVPAQVSAPTTGVDSPAPVA